MSQKHRGRFSDSSHEVPIEKSRASSTKMGNILTPTEVRMQRSELERRGGCRHLMPHLRFGRVSMEVFSKRELEKMSVDLITPPEESNAKKETRKKTDNTKQAATEVRVGRPGQERKGAKAGRSKPKQEGHGVQTPAKAREAKSSEKVKREARFLRKKGKGAK